jgi:hypothetical protein
VSQLPVNYFCEDYLCNDPDLINLEILSPEILDGELISTIGGKNKSVVWSLGVLLYELLTESKPYLLGAARYHWKYHGNGGSQEEGSGTEKKILRKYIQAGMVGLYESIVSERMVHLLRRMLTFNPGNRPNLIDVKIELATFLQDEAGVENIVGGVSKNLPGSNEFVPKSEFMKNRMLNLKDRLAKIPEPEPPKKVGSMIEENEVSEYSWKDSGFSESRDDRKSNLKSYVTPDDFDDDEYDFDSDVEEPPAFGGNDRGSFGVRAGVQYVGSDVRYSEGPWAQKKLVPPGKSPGLPTSPKLRSDFSFHESDNGLKGSGSSGQSKNPKRSNFNSRIGELQDTINEIELMEKGENMDYLDDRPLEEDKAMVQSCEKTNSRFMDPPPAQPESEVGSKPVKSKFEQSDPKKTSAQKKTDKPSYSNYLRWSEGRNNQQSMIHSGLPKDLMQVKRESQINAKKQSIMSGISQTNDGQEFRHEKLYFARLRRRVLVHREICELLSSTQKNSALLALLQFLVMKRAVFCYNLFIRRVENPTDDRNPFDSGKASHSQYTPGGNWSKFTKTELYMKLVAFVSADLTDALGKMKDLYKKAKKWLQSLPPASKKEMNVYIEQLNFKSNDGQWTS